MSASPKPGREYRNQLLSRLPDEEYDSLSPCFRIEHLRLGQVLYERGQPIQTVYFPCDCVLSVLAYMTDGSAVEVGTIGNEGFSGIDVVAGATTATATTICQVANDCVVMSAADFRRATAGDTSLHRITKLYLQAYISLVSQSVACNRLHTLQQRFARWILMTHERVGMDEFRLTQEFLAFMLGVHRPSVSIVAGEFQLAGLLQYKRGIITILDRPGLEGAACECYEVVKQRFGDLLGVTRS
jgi:CRP-like cAMP-binding protein